MKRYRVVHTTGFKYPSKATASYNEVRMLPARDEHQLVFSSKLEITPHPSSHEYLDFFGTRVVMFEVLELHDELIITSNNLVELRDRKPITSDLGWQELESAATKSVELTDALTPTRRTSVPSDLVKFAERAKQNGSPNQVALEICKHVFSKMTYSHGVTGVHSVASEAWSKKVGVCQDFTHLVIGALRAIGIPARYVSGYLHPSLNPVVGKKVTGESHAWVEWFSGEWQPYDPTNDVEVQDRHIVVGRGRDYDDVAPLRGVFAGPDSSELFVTVEITREA